MCPSLLLDCIRIILKVSFHRFVIHLCCSIVAMNALRVGFGEQNALMLLFHTVLVWWRRWAGRNNSLALIHDMQMTRLWLANSTVHHSNTNSTYGEQESDRERENERERQRGERERITGLLVGYWLIEYIEELPRGTVSEGPCPDSCSPAEHPDSGGALPWGTFKDTFNRLSCCFCINIHFE